MNLLLHAILRKTTGINHWFYCIELSHLLIILKFFWCFIGLLMLLKILFLLAKTSLFKRRCLVNYVQSFFYFTVRFRKSNVELICFGLFFLNYWEFKKLRIGSLIYPLISYVKLKFKIYVQKFRQTNKVQYNFLKVEILSHFSILWLSHPKIHWKKNLKFKWQIKSYKHFQILYQKKLMIFN